MDKTINPVLKYQRKLKQKKKEHRKEAHQRSKQIEKLKLNAKQKEEEMKAQQIIDNQEEKEEPKKISEPVIDKHAKIKVPGYSQEFSKAHIEYNRAFMDPKLRTQLPSKSNVLLQNNRIDQLEYQPKPNEQIYKNNDGVIITDEVLKILGGNIDPKKVKIGNRNQRQNNTQIQDPFNKVTEQMNYDYLKDLEEQKHPKNPPPLPPVVEPEIRKRIFIYENDEVKLLPQPAEKGNVIIGESTVRKCKTVLGTDKFVPPQLKKNVEKQGQNIQQQQPQQQYSQQQQPQLLPQSKQQQFRELLTAPREKQSSQDIMDRFMKDLQQL